ncbi:MAG TPA: hypothetical protein VGX16_02785 [Solirubrobacteraceae bacterium]|jgi:hypothetical protein|nr:hypothetical protein [Solirubrobacteraceae bacterium]
MPEPTRTREEARSAAGLLRNRVEEGGARFWKYADFKDLPSSAVATTLSRLAREGVLQRKSKGVYYRPVPTTLGLSVAGASAAAAQTLRAPLHPAGLTAANFLGLSAQNPGLPEYATTAPGAPRALRRALVHTGRPSQRAGLSAEEGAILETLRERARSSDLSPEETARRLMQLLAEDGRFGRLAKAALAESPRVRAMLGALGQELDVPSGLLEPLRESLNPLSRFDFGVLRVLPNAREWQAK